MIRCPNCDQLMCKGEKCPECNHTDHESCKCATCSRKRGEVDNSLRHEADPQGQPAAPDQPQQ